MDAVGEYQSYMTGLVSYSRPDADHTNTPTQFVQTASYHKTLTADAKSVEGAVSVLTAQFDLAYQNARNSEFTDSSFTGSSPWAAHARDVVAAGTVQLSDSQPHQQTHDEDVAQAETDYADTLADETAVHGQAVEDAAQAEADQQGDDEDDNTSDDTGPAVTIDDAPDASSMTQTSTLGAQHGFGNTAAQQKIFQSLDKSLAADRGPLTFTTSGGESTSEDGMTPEFFSFQMKRLSSQNCHGSNDCELDLEHFNPIDPTGVDAFNLSEGLDPTNGHYDTPTGEKNNTAAGVSAVIEAPQESNPEALLIASVIDRQSPEYKAEVRRMNDYLHQAKKLREQGLEKEATSYENVAQEIANELKLSPHYVDKRKRIGRSIESDAATYDQQMFIANLEGTVDLLTAATPFVNDARDVIEVSTGKDLATQEEFTPLEYGITVVAAVIPLIPGKAVRRVARNIPGGQVLRRLKTKAGDLVSPFSDGLGRMLRNLSDNLPNRAIRNAAEELGGQCFAAGTPVLTSRGAVPIQELNVGDEVLSRPELNPNAPLRSRRIEKVFTLAATIYELHVGGQCIRTTHDHPFYVMGRGWTPLADLSAGDQLLGDDRELTEVTEIVNTSESASVYNIRVADDHTYFVGSEEWGFSVWVHNTYSIAKHPDGFWAIKDEATGEWAKTANGNYIRANDQADLSGTLKQLNDLLSDVPQTTLTAGKNFRAHFVNHKSILEELMGTKYPKYKSHGQAFLDDVVTVHGLV